MPGRRDRLVARRLQLSARALFSSPTFSLDFFRGL